MSYRKLTSTSTILGISLLTVLVGNQYAEASTVGTPSGCTANTINNGSSLSLNVYTASNGICTPPSTWTPQIFAWQGRAGAPNHADYQYGLGDNGATNNNNGSQPSVIYRDWTASNLAVPWTITYNAATKQATLSIGSGSSVQSVNYTSTTDLGGGLTPFNGFSLEAVVGAPDTINNPPKLVKGVTASITVDAVTDTNGNVVTNGFNPLGEATATNSSGTGQLNEILFSTGSNTIQEVNGRLDLAWPLGGNPESTFARSRVLLTFKALDPNVDPAAVPEPLTILGSLTTLGLAVALKRKLAK